MAMTLFENYIYDKKAIRLSPLIESGHFKMHSPSTIEECNTNDTNIKSKEKENWEHHRAAFILLGVYRESVQDISDVKIHRILRSKIKLNRQSL